MARFESLDCPFEDEDDGWFLAMRRHMEESTSAFDMPPDEEDYGLLSEGHAPTLPETKKAEANKIAKD